MMAMQKDAERRVREMQERSKSLVKNEPPPPPPPPPPKPQPQPQPIHNETPVNKGFLEGILPDIKIDEEKALIIFLLIILARNGADMKMLLALGYLLM
ncbi:MAG: hypothetical protein J5992_07325 [Oscillospiraceae bacterium]|nr:hypothetical protein [Oscillospiraceae bacterium]